MLAAHGRDLSAGEAAARDANAYGSITHGRDRYGTVLGKRGMTLSRGEKPRLFTARAFLEGARCARSVWAGERAETLPQAASPRV